MLGGACFVTWECLGLRLQAGTVLVLQTLLSFCLSGTEGGRLVVLFGGWATLCFFPNFLINIVTGAAELPNPSLYWL